MNVMTWLKKKVFSCECAWIKAIERCALDLSRCALEWISIYLSNSSVIRSDLNINLNSIYNSLALIPSLCRCDTNWAMKPHFRINLNNCVCVRESANNLHSFNALSMWNISKWYLNVLKLVSLISITNNRLKNGYFPFETIYFNLHSIYVPVKIYLICYKHFHLICCVICTYNLSNNLKAYSCCLKCSIEIYSFPLVA